MKKFFSIICSILVLALALFMPACVENNDLNGDCNNGHIFTKYYYNDNAACGQNGTETATCDRYKCNATHTRERRGTALVHSVKLVRSVYQTCTTDGLKTHYKCIFCNGLFADKTASTPLQLTDVVIPFGHRFSNDYQRSEQGHWRVCIADGCSGYSEIEQHVTINGDVATESHAVCCIVCGYEVQPALEHQHIIAFEEETPSGCSTNGLLEHYKCILCDAMFSDELGQNRVYSWEISKPFWHEWDTEFTIDIPATPFRQGEKSKHCLHCDARTNIVPYLHDDWKWSENV